MATKLGRPAHLPEQRGRHSPSPVHFDDLPSSPEGGAVLILLTLLSLPSTAKGGELLQVQWEAGVAA